jgi:prepilin-type N-terminal cleavage/methylation domain-containing protein/prepilin-type processing-associated H-X9-DG protein
MFRTTRRAFTLIELLVVIAIIAILAAILFPVFARARERGMASACLSNGRQIGMAFMQYADDNDGRLPLTGHSGASESWINTIQPYIHSRQIYRCPSDLSTNWDRPLEGEEDTRHSSYFLNHWLSGTQKYTVLSAIRSPASVIYVSEGAKNRTGDHFHPFLWTNDPASPGGPSASLFDSATDETRELALNQHGGGMNDVYADGHARWGKWSQLWFQKPGVYEGAFDPRQ